MTDNCTFKHWRCFVLLILLNTDKLKDFRNALIITEDSFSQRKIALKHLVLVIFRFLQWNTGLVLLFFALIWRRFGARRCGARHATAPSRLQACLIWEYKCFTLRECRQCTYGTDLTQKYKPASSRDGTHHRASWMRWQSQICSVKISFSDIPRISFN